MSHQPGVFALLTRPAGLFEHSHDARFPTVVQIFFVFLFAFGFLALLSGGISGLVWAAALRFTMAWQAALDSPIWLIGPEISLMALGGSFIIAGIIWWTHRFERRSAASLGLADRYAAKRLFAGLLVGGGLSLLITVIATMAAPDDSLSALLSLLGSAAVKIDLPNLGWVLAYMGGVFVYAALEEILFRGWMFSAMTARLGVLPGAFLSSAVFALHHFDVFTYGVVYGLAWCTAFFVSGLLFCVVVVGQKSLYGAIGLHAGFNLFITYHGTLWELDGDESVGIANALFYSIEPGIPVDARWGLDATFYADLSVFSVATLFAIAWFGFAARPTISP